MGIGERIQYYLDKHDMQQKELAEKIWIDPSVLNRIIKNRRPIRSDELSAIAKVFNISADELLGANTPIITNLQPIENMRRVPIIGIVRCGAGACAYEDIDEYISIDDTYRPDEMRGFRAIGDSMEPEIHDGDICLVHLQEEAPDGALVVVVICDSGEDCEGTVKRIHKADGTIILQATNPAYPPRVFTGASANNVRIVGRVVEVRHKV